MASFAKIAFALATTLAMTTVISCIPLGDPSLPSIPFPTNGPPVCPKSLADGVCGASCSSDLQCPSGQICCEVEECGSSVCVEGVCNSSNCGPAPLAPSFLCEDGESFSGFVCEVLPNGFCGFEFKPCPDPEPVVCGPNDCGPQLGAPVFLCEDGESISGFFCQPNETGTCSFQFQPCPENTPPPPVVESCSSDICCGKPSTIEDATESCDCWNAGLCPFKCPIPQVCEGVCPTPVPFDFTFCALVFIAPECISSENCNKGEVCCNSGLCGSGICVDVDGCTPDECGIPPLAPSVLCEDGVTVSGFFCGLGDNGQCGFQFQPCPEEISPPVAQLPPPADPDTCFGLALEDCEALPFCAPAFGSPVDCSASFDTLLEPVYGGCLPLFTACLQVFTYGVDESGNGLLFPNSCLPEEYTLSSLDDICCNVALPGDINGDCILNIQDIVEILDFIAGNVIPTACEVETSDLSEDGIITIQDLVLGLECISGANPDCVVECPDETFLCGANGLECSVANEACQTFIGGVCGGTFPLPDGSCPPGCSDCGFGGGFPGSSFPSCNCPSVSCVPKIPTIECISPEFPFGPCICNESADGVQTVTCFGA